MPAGDEIYLVSESDGDLAHRVALYLARFSIDEWHELHIEAAFGQVELRGVLSSIRSRQLAVSAACHVAGVIRVIDRITILQARSGHRSRPRSVFARQPEQSSCSLNVSVKECFHVRSTVG